MPITIGELRELSHQGFGDVEAALADPATRFDVAAALGLIVLRRTQPDATEADVDRLTEDELVALLAPALDRGPPDPSRASSNGSGSPSRRRSGAPRR